MKNVKKVINLMWDGDVDYKEFEAYISPQQLKELEDALDNKYVMGLIEEYEGIPFPGDDEEWDDLVSLLPPLQLLQNFINEVD